MLNSIKNPKSKIQHPSSFQHRPKANFPFRLSNFTNPPFFIGNGWKPFTSDGETAFFDPENGLAISDTHRGNLILMPDGLLAPIDLRIQKLSGSILDIVKLLTAAPSAAPQPTNFE